MKRFRVIIRFSIFTVGLFLINLSPFAAYLKNLPIKLKQPDGTILNCYATGDEYYNWLHDKDGYTIIRNSKTRYYVYANKIEGHLAPTQYIAGKTDPKLLENAGIRKRLLPAPAVIRNRFPSPPKESVVDTTQAEALVSAPKTGTINNLVIFIRFSDQEDFSDTSIYGDMFNASNPDSNSMRSYFKEASYDKLTIDSYFFPNSNPNIKSYKDAHPRGYYVTYDEIDNPLGYNTDIERKEREDTLLKNAIEEVSEEVPPGLNIDGEPTDNYIDNICFIIRGAYEVSEEGKPNEILWGHRWNLTTYDVRVNNKRVGSYNFQVEALVDQMGVGVLAHEMFHTLDAPDLYVYPAYYDNEDERPEPVSIWDLMATQTDTPQHMTAYMKFKYGEWISSIPEITKSGTYTLNPLRSSSNNCYKIASPYSTSEYFVVEYRDNMGTFEAQLPGTGLLIYRINSTRENKGNKYNSPFEVYVYREDGTLSNSGLYYDAVFSAETERTQINDSTNPSSFLTDGTQGGLDISNISTVGTTMSFYVDLIGDEIKKIYGENLALNSWGKIKVEVQAPSDGNYYLKVFSAYLGAPHWQWESTSSALVQLQSGQNFTFSFDVMPDTSTETFQFWLYKQAIIPGVFFVKDKVTDSLSAGVSGNPEISSISPTQGSVGSSVDIYGANFESTQGTVQFNGANASITSWSDSHISTSVPAMASDGPIVVHTNGGKTSNGYSFDVINTDFMLSNPRVFPSSGKTDDLYVFRVDYYDTENTAPTVQQIVIDDGVPIDVVLEGGTSANGVYRYGPIYLTEGQHHFKFHFENGIDTPKDTSVVYEPYVTGNVVPTGRNVGISNFQVNPYQVNPGYSLNLTATFNNYGNQAENIITHWYLYDPSGNEIRHIQETRNNVPAGNGSTGQLIKTLQTNSTQGYWTAVVRAELFGLSADDDPSDNYRSASFYVGPQQNYTQYRCRDGVTNQTNVIIYEASGVYGFRVVGFYNQEVRVDIIKNGSPIVSNVSWEKDDIRKYDNGQYFVYVDGYSIGYISTLHGTPYANPFNYSPLQPQGSAGSPVIWSSTPQSGTITEGNQYDIINNTNVRSWYYDSDISGNTLTREFRVLSSANPGSYKFWIREMIQGSNDHFLRETDFIVDPGHDISVSNISPENNSSATCGQNIPVSIIVTGAGGYSEHPLISLSITGPGNYSYTDQESPYVTGSTTINFSPSWNTLGLSPGDYTLTISATINNDINTTNDSISAVIHLLPALLPPTAPNLVSCIAQSSTQILLAWDDNSNDEEGFKIERSTNGTSWVLAGTVGIGVTAFSDSSLTPDTFYYYRVKAYNIGGESCSNLLSARTQKPLSITVQYPNGGEQFERGKSLPIYWTSTGSIGNVDILLEKGGSTVIADNAQNTGLYSWTIPDSAVLGNDYQIRIEKSDNSSVFDASDGYFAITVPNKIPDSERDTLIAFYNSTNGDYWTNKTGWKTPPLHTDGFAMPGTENTWFGIYCNLANTHVRWIDIYQNNLVGTIPADIGNLPYLEGLALPANSQLAGSIPAQLGNLNNLNSLSLVSNNHTGAIPPELGNLINLRNLYLSGNPALDPGPIPEWIQNLTLLEQLGFENTNRTGPIPSWLGNLSSLSICYLSFNQITGNIPSSLGNLSNMAYLVLTANQLSGNIPQEFGNLINLTYLNIRGNELSGNLPPTLINLTNLSSSLTDLGYNAFYASDSTLHAFLNSKDPDWESTQTIAPNNIEASAQSSSSVKVSWTPIAYTGDSGSYQVYYATTSGGPYTPAAGMTTDKNASKYTVDQLSPDTTYYFVVVTRTNPHSNNTNIVQSEYSAEASAKTLPYAPSGSLQVTLEPPAAVTAGAQWNIDGGAWQDSGATVSGLSLGLHSVNYKAVIGWTAPASEQVTIASGQTTQLSRNYTTGPILTVTSPNGGESWGGGTDQNIAWTSTGTIANVKIDYSTDSGSNWLPIIASTSNNGSYAWTVPNTPSSSCLARVSDVSNASLFDTSNALFSIVAANAPEINIKQATTNIPKGGSFDFSTRAIGTNNDITFTVENLGAANLDLGGSPIIIIAGTNQDQFSVQQQPISPVSPQSNTTFIIRFTPTSAGLKTASISIANNDSNENPYDITLTGTGVSNLSTLFSEDWNDEIIHENGWSFVDDVIPSHGGHKASLVNGELFINAWDDWTQGCGVISKKGFGVNTTLNLKFRINRVQVANQYQDILYFMDSGAVNENHYPTGNLLFSLCAGNDNNRTLFILDAAGNTYSLGNYIPDQYYNLEINFMGTETTITSNGYTVTMPLSFPKYYIWFGAHVADSYFDDLKISAQAAIYGFNEGAGSSFNDEAGGTNSGTLFNHAQWVLSEVKDNGGLPGYAIQYDGADDYARLMQQPISDGPFTIMLWAKKLGIGGGSWINLVRTSSPGTDNGYTLYWFNDNSIQGLVATSGAKNFLVYSGAPENNWVHIVLALSNSKGRLFINGALVQELDQPGNLNPPNWEFSIGGQGGGTDDAYFNGMVDGLKIFHTGLDPSLINAIYLSEHPDADPIMVSLTPNSGAAGDQVTIAGSNFGSAQGSVTFNGLSASITSWAANQIVTTVPDNASTGPVVVHTAAGKISNGVTFTVSIIVQKGALQVTLGPSGAVTAGAQWNVDGGAWQDSGATVSGLSVGLHTVNYKPVTGWDAPASEQVTIASGQTMQLSRSYILQTGSLQVTLGPSAAVTAGAQWNVDSGAWQDSGATVSELAVGSYQVNYKTIGGWTSPPSEEVTINNGQTTQLSGTYLKNKAYKDFNADGQDDILWRYYGSGGYNYVWYMGQSGSGTTGFQEIDSRVVNMYQAPSPAQIYWDVREAGGLFNRIVDKVYRDAREAEGLPTWTEVQQIQEGDFSKLGQAAGSQILKNPMENMVRIAGGLICIGAAALPSVLDANWQIAGTGDFSGDGKVDILWRYYGSGGYNYVWYMDGVTCTGGAVLPSVTDLNWQIAGTGDFNGDGKVDILWRYYGAGGYNYVWYMDGVTCTGGESLTSVQDLKWKIANR